MSENPPPPHAIRRLYCYHCGFILDVPVDCGDRFCSVCSPRRSFRVRNRLQWILRNSPPPPGYMLKMVTLSTANCKDLDLGVRHLIKSFRKLRQRHFWKKNVIGGATIIEIKGRPNNWHPHLHILCYARWLDWYKLQPDWAAVSGGTACYITSPSDAKAMYYVTKYTTKADVPPFLEYQVGKVLSRFRLFQRFGSWHALILPKKLYDYPCPNCTKDQWCSDITVNRASRAMARGS